MSKIFDSLKRAEEARRKIASQKEPVEVAEELSSPPGRAPLTAGGALPKGLAQEIGVLRNSLESALKGKDRRTVLFTSAVMSEGTTTIAVNYAKLIALQGSEKVLLCEMNARNPSLARLFSIDPEPGIGSVFSGNNTLSSVVRNLDAYNLSVATIGTMDLTDMQVNLSTRFPALLQEAFSAYTTIVFDAPAVSVASETAPMSAFVDGVVIVVEVGKTKREVVERSINVIHQQEGTVLGVILNRKKYYIPEFLYKRT